MGCGCGRGGKGVSRSERIKRRPKPLKSTKINAAKVAKKAIMSSPLLTTRSDICLACVESRQASSERKKGIRICHKTNRLINNIIRDPRFVCPLGKF